MFTTTLTSVSDMELLDSQIQVKNHFLRKIHDSDADDLPLGYIQLMDFNDIYTDWELDAQVDEFRINKPDKYRDIVDRLDLWFSIEVLRTLATMFDAIGYSYLTFTTFKQLLTDIEIPACLLYTSPSPRDLSTSRMPSSA